MKLFKTVKNDRFTRADLGVLAGGVALFAAICSVMLTKSSIWFDEAFGAYLIRFNYFDVARYTASDVHPPLYYWALKAWSSVFGYTDAGLRSMSVFFGVIAIIFAFLLVHRWLGRRAAWTGLLFMAITPFFVRYGIEARMYTMMAAEVFAGTYVLTLADRSKKTWQWVLYGVIVGLGMLTQYFTLLAWLTHWLWRAIVHRSAGLKGKKLARDFFSRQWIVAHVVGIAVFAPWIWPLIHQVVDVQANGFWIPPITPATPINFLTSVVYYLEQDQVQSWGAAVFVAFIAALTVLVVVLSRRVLKGEQKNYFLLIALLAAVPPFLLLVLSLPPLRPSFVDRYAVPSSLAIGLLIGVSIGLSRGLIGRRKWWALVIVSFGIFVYGLTNLYRLGNYNTTLHQSNNTRQLMEAVRAKTPDAAMIADSPWLYYEAAFYSTSVSPVYFIDANTEYKYGSLLMLQENDLGKIKNLSDFETTHKTFWYIGRPVNNETSLPGTNLQVIDKIRVNDSVNGSQAYEAVEYSVL